MGSFDVFCAICGGGFHGVDYQESSEDEDDFRAVPSRYVDDAVVNAQNTEWTEDLRVVGSVDTHDDVSFERDSRYYITGTGRHEDGSTVWVNRGDDPNMITVEEIAQITGNPDWSHRSSDSEISLLVYYSCEYPIHHSCLDVFTRALRIAKGRVSTDESVALDIKPLVLAFTSLKPSGFFMTHLEVDFFEIQGTQGQQWEVEHGHEPYVMDPLGIPNLVDYPKRFTLAKAQLQQPEARTYAGDDGIAKLPIEIREMLLEGIPFTDLRAMQQVSRPVNSDMQRPSFWRRRLHVDMPYLWEINEKKDYADNIDWKEVYKRLYRLSYLGKWNRSAWQSHLQGAPQLRHEPYPARNSRMQRPQRKELKEISDYSFIEPNLIAVASRRRVWQCTQQVLNRYLAKC